MTSQPPARVRDFAKTVAARVPNDPAFARALLQKTIAMYVNGEPESARLILRDLLNGTAGLEALADEIHKPAKRLHRMLCRSNERTSGAEPEGHSGFNLESRQKLRFDSSRRLEEVLTDSIGIFCGLRGAGA